ncbi:right-handed parallel beta-helix repeat-containing protein [Coraliomargarita sp. SDUM461004]|uniref:Right-handed parallel beta-helix repeat-containing protein n=1 Tax=Thalassobacterium sedimentorum TaxID=3041258 RepID=A0ABU1AIA8_9BACT|nr:right-handed parallel beta-helix repeat-containing protein [Coraliomargarita sp. SDUM461004]MDQ8193615.1 right-handed parallel beta-helix repeat-containing protein [Coraliomargarita sp. SDUM461004]
MTTIFATERIEIHREGEAAALEFTTIQAAITAAQAGDTIRISEGVYHENLIISGKHGSEEQPFILEAAAGAHVIIDGADQELQHPGSNRWTWDEEALAWTAEVPWQGKASRALLTWASHADERLIAAHHNREYFELGQRGDALYRIGRKVLLRLEDQSDPNLLALNIGMGEGIIQLYDSSHWIIRGVHLKHAGYAGVHLKGPTVSDICIEDISVETAFRGISTEEYGVGFSNRITVRNCRIFNFWNFDWEWKQGYKDHVVASSDENAPVRGGGIHIFANDSEIANCEIAGQWDGIRVQGENIQVHGNLLHHIKDDMMELESNNSSHVRVYNNMGYLVFAGFSVVSNQKGPIYIYRNLVQSNLHSLMFDDVYRYGYPLKFGNDWGPNASNIYIYHNTFDSNGRSMFVARKSRAEKWKQMGWVNNIFSRRQTGVVGIEQMGPASNDLIWEGNLFVLADELKVLESFDPVYANAGILGAPDLLAPSATPPNFQLGANSDARQQGTRRVMSEGWPDSIVNESGNSDVGAIPYGFTPPQYGTLHERYNPWGDVF